MKKKVVDKIERRMNYDNEQSSVEWWFFVVLHDDYVHLLLPHYLITNKWIASGYDLLGVQKTSRMQKENTASRVEIDREREKESVKNLECINGIQQS